MSSPGEDSHLDEEEDILSEEASDDNEDNISLDDAGSDSDLDDDSLDSDIDEEGDHSKVVLTFNAPEEDNNEIDQNVEIPEPIKMDSQIADFCCHPKENIVAVGSIYGPVVLHRYATADTGNKEVITFDHHKKNCRTVRFSNSGEHLFTGANYQSIYVVDLQSNSIFREFIRPGGSPVYTILPIDDYIMASGEEDGEVVLWDFRMQAPIETFQDCEDYISSLTINSEKKILLATSGDGILTTYNVRAKKLVMQSEDFDCDLLCAGIFKKGQKVVVGAGDGSLNIFNWGEFGNISDRFPGHPQAVDSMVVLSDDVIVTGCEDGKIRAVQLFPNRFLGVLGSHNGFTVEKLSLTFDKSMVASASHDCIVKFWDLSGIESLKEEDVNL
ncbi:hypothetical protein JTE90_020341 [Oedothorax gibbosus]|uniref:WD repeat-containing protein 55 homolog n=1 Tax=Oedothorax gibbosus TaxID=931172 RepID=A0AAV6VR40_9ARAC|nr:hypothetical protein JTE90_020341 [Oedothorax gibbosus]